MITKLRNPKIIINGAKRETIEENNETTLKKILGQNALLPLGINLEAKIKIERKFLNKNKINFRNIIINVNLLRD